MYHFEGPYDIFELQAVQVNGLIQLAALVNKNVARTMRYMQIPRWSPSEQIHWPKK